MTRNHAHHLAHASRLATLWVRLALTGALAPQAIMLPLPVPVPVPVPVHEPRSRRPLHGRGLETVDIAVSVNGRRCRSGAG